MTAPAAPEPVLLLAAPGLAETLAYATERGLVRLEGMWVDHAGDLRRGDRAHCPPPCYLLAGGELPTHPYTGGVWADGGCDWQAAPGSQRCFQDRSHPVHHPGRSYPASSAAPLAEQFGYNQALCILAGAR